MDSYFDSGIIVKLYVQEANNDDAIRLVSGHVGPTRSPRGRRWKPGTRFG